MIKMLVMDVDGTLTDGKIYISEHGELFKVFNVKDGYGITKLLNHNIVPVILTGRKSKIVEKRCEELKILEVYQGIGNKIEVLQKVAAKYQLSYMEIAYIGDDENDIACMQLCGKTACPADAVLRVRQIVDVVTVNKGGDGAVREFIESFLDGE